ncbi:hypothetical protein [Lichenifustis flavocetrariae]|uniref:Uncharacterized protein n=1 Tax=Lichenifustis flavocetrariae TaxID=2949735 RepID=A0AA41YYT7_9HYPH|nr:hypothetical protein [Lichenifustis flavocetrariae]MCW6510614.1 hypothetical protein [Lichenifustis flavocetrariae]
MNAAFDRRSVETIACAVSNYYADHDESEQFADTMRDPDQISGFENPG